MSRPKDRNMQGLVGLSLLLLLSSCSSDLEGLTTEELQDRIYECNSSLEQSPGMAISCDNYRRECKRRREAGHFVC